MESRSGRLVSSPDTAGPTKSPELRSKPRTELQSKERWYTGATLHRAEIPLTVVASGAVEKC
jgi:hypothetical protein